MHFRTVLIPVSLLLVSLPLTATAGPCDAHFTFDGTLADSSGNGYDGVAIGSDTAGNAPAPRMAYAEGKTGQALKLDGSAAVRAPLDLSAAGCPQVTITAWVKFDDNPTKGSQYILSSGLGGPGLVREGVGLSVYGGGKRYRESKALRGGGWEFVAASLDYTAGKMTVHWRNRVMEKDISTKGTKQADIWIGAVDDQVRMPVTAGLIDDVRVIGGILTADQVRQLRNNAGKVGVMPKPTGLDQGPPTAEDRIAERGALPELFGDPDLPPDIGDRPVAASQIPGDQFEPKQIPGDQFEPQQIPGDQFEPQQLPGDQFEPHQLPGDQYEPGVGFPPATGGVYELGQPAPSVLAGDSGTSSALPGGRDLSSGTQEALQQARDESGPPDITYGSEEEGEAAANAVASYTGDVLAYSGISGIRGDYRNQVVFTESQQLLQYVQTLEENDKPCKVQILGMRPLHGTMAQSHGASRTATIDACGDGLPRIGFGLFRDTIDSPSQTGPVTRIQTCRPSTNKRVKGFRAEFRSIEYPSGQYGSDIRTMNFDQKLHCNVWNEWRACPANTFAVGLRMHFKDGSSLSPKDFLVGVELVCSSITWKELTAEQGNEG